MDMSLLSLVHSDRQPIRGVQSILYRRSVTPVHYMPSYEQSGAKILGTRTGSYSHWDFLFSLFLTGHFVPPFAANRTPVSLLEKGAIALMKRWRQTSQTDVVFKDNGLVVLGNAFSSEGRSVWLPNEAAGYEIMDDLKDTKRRRTESQGE